MPSDRVAGAGRWLVAGLVAATAACSGGPRPPADPPPRTQAPAQPAAAAPPPPPVVPAAPAAPRPPAAPVVIEPAEPEEEAPPTLAEAAARERQRRRQAGAPIAVINDANLEEHAVGQLTFMEDEPVPAAADGSAAAGDAEGPDEQYWRERVLGIRQRLADAAAEVPGLEDRVAELRRRFYDTDDAYYRDTRIKPAWDRVIDQIAQTRATVEALRGELAAALEEGRLVGALPGWLREGIDLVPPEPEPEPETYEPGEPVIVGEDAGGGGS